MSKRRQGEEFSSDDLLRALRDALNSDEGTLPEGEFARLDYERKERIGTPEIIFAESKSHAQVLELIDRMLERNGRALVSRASENLIGEIETAYANSRFRVDRPARASLLRVSNPTTTSPRSVSGRVAIFTAGTSDIPRAEEVRLVSEEMGVEVRLWADLGVAGLHRLIRPFREAIDWGSAVIVVVAGMDGALPSVIAGLSPVPVIGLPVSVGYGYGGQGEGALMTMLQSCAPGITVVNIDNSVGAGVAAARIARLAGSPE